MERGAASPDTLTPGQVMQWGSGEVRQMLELQHHWSDVQRFQALFVTKSILSSFGKVGSSFCAVSVFNAKLTVAVAAYLFTFYCRVKVPVTLALTSPSSSAAYTTV